MKPTKKPEPLKHIAECSAPNDIQICPRCIARENANATKVTTELKKALTKADEHIQAQKDKVTDLFGLIESGPGEMPWKEYAQRLQDAVTVAGGNLRQMFRRDAMTSEDKAAVASTVEMLERVVLEEP